MKVDSVIAVLQRDRQSYAYTFFVDGQTTLRSFTNLVFKRVNGGFNGFLLTYESDVSIPSDFSTFSGKVTSRDLDGKVITAQYFKDGQITNKSNTGGRTQTCYQDVTFNRFCNFKGKSTATGLEPCMGTVEIVISITYSEGCYITESNGQAGGGASYRWSNGTFVPFEYWSDGGSGGGPSNSGGGSNNCNGGSGISSGSDPNSCSDRIVANPPNDDQIMSLIIEKWNSENICLQPSFVANPCINNTWGRLKDTRAAFTLLRKFINNEIPGAKVCMEVATTLVNNAGDTLNGVTNGQVQPIQIKLSQKSASQHSELEVAKTIFHELIHAEMWRKIQSIGGVNNLDSKNFPGLFDYYSRYIPILDQNGGFSFPNGTPQHNLMANHYLNLIADALMEFDGADKNNNDLRSKYIALAWSGLKETEIFKSKSDLEKNNLKTLANSLVASRTRCQ